MADGPHNTEHEQLSFRRPVFRSASDKLEQSAWILKSSNLWLVTSLGDEKCLRQARHEDSFRNEANYVLLLKLGERATDRFKFQTEKVSNILAPHWQRHSFRKCREARQPVAPADEKYRNSFLCRSIAEQQQLILCHVKFADREFNQLPHDAGAGLNKFYKVVAWKTAQGHRANCVGREVMPVSERHSEEIAR